MKREELIAYNWYDELDDSVQTFRKDDADKVMDAMEARIKELEAMLKDKDGVMDTCRGLIESANVMSKSAEDKLLNRIKELEAENSRLKSIVGDEEYTEGLAGLAQRNVGLREENERLKKEVFDYHQLQWRHDALIDENEKLEAANFDLQSHFDVLKDDYDELKAQVPKWISVKDRLPDILEQVIIFYGNVFYCVTYYGETECWGVCENVKFSPNVVTHWMLLPPPPTTEESSATEKENG